MFLELFRLAGFLELLQGYRTQKGRDLREERIRSFSSSKSLEHCTLQVALERIGLMADLELDYRRWVDWFAVWKKD